MLSKFIIPSLPNTTLENFCIMDLPTNVLIHVLSQLPFNMITSICITNIALHYLVNSNAFWKLKFEKHFPDAMKLIDVYVVEDWKALFIKTEEIEYKPLTDFQKKLLSLIKEKNFEEISKLDFSVDILLDGQDKNNLSILNIAQLNKDQRILDFFYSIALKDFTLLNGDIDVNKKTDDGRTVFFWAIACHQDPAFITSLLSSEEKFYEEYTELKFKPIHVAAGAGALGILKMLIAQTRDLLEEKDDRDQKPLHWAVNHGHADVVAYLLTQNVAINDASVVQTSEYTPLHLAILNRHSEIFRMLLQAGSDIKQLVSNIRKIHTIHLAAEAGLLETVKTLIRMDANSYDQSDVNGQTPLLYAARAGRADIVAYLISLKANVHVKTIDTTSDDDDGKTALYWAAEGGHESVVALLVKAGANPAIALGSNKFQPIHLLARLGKLAGIKLLIELNPDYRLSANAIAIGRNSRSFRCY